MLYSALYITGYLPCPDCNLGSGFLGDTNGIFVGFLFLALVFPDFAPDGIIDPGRNTAYFAPVFSLALRLDKVIGISFTDFWHYQTSYNLYTKKCVPTRDAFPHRQGVFCKFTVN